MSPRLVRVNVDDVKSNHVPLVHHSVSERFAKVSEYRPYALRNLHFKIIDDEGMTTDMPHGISSLN